MKKLVESEKLKNSKQELTGRAAEHECASELEDDGEDDVSTGLRLNAASEDATAVRLLQIHCDTSKS